GRTGASRTRFSGSATLPCVKTTARSAPSTGLAPSPPSVTSSAGYAISSASTAPPPPSAKPNTTKTCPSPSPGSSQPREQRKYFGRSPVPAGMKEKGASKDPEALIDVLVPAYTSRARENVQIEEDLFATEVPGLQLALARPPARITLEMRRLNGEVLQCELPFAD